MDPQYVNGGRYLHSAFKWMHAYFPLSDIVIPDGDDELTSKMISMVHTERLLP